jgi:hypothetical protein
MCHPIRMLNQLKPHLEIYIVGIIPYLLVCSLNLEQGSSHFNGPIIKFESSIPPLFGPSVLMRRGRFRAHLIRPIHLNLPLTFNISTPQAKGEKTHYPYCQGFWYNTRDFCPWRFQKSKYVHCLYVILKKFERIGYLRAEPKRRSLAMSNLIYDSKSLLFLAM